MEITLEKVRANQVLELQKISRQTFYETFYKVNTEQNMTQYLETELSLEKLSLELSNPHSLFYFAIFEKEIIGYLKINFGGSQTELKDNKALEIERIYVLEEFHGKNIGQILYHKAISVAKEKNADYVWLGVWEENPKAIAFYKKNGFVAFDHHQFRLGEDLQTDIMMKKELKK